MDVIEFNASDKRNKSSLSEIRELVHSRQSIRGKQCLIMDEVDGMSGGDRGGISELCQIIKHSQIPIICICNDRYKPCLKSLVSLCDEVKFSKPNKLAITKRLMDICKKEGLMITENALAQLIESSNNDIRSVLNSLQMATYSGSSQSRFTFDDACKHGTDSGALPDNFFLMTSNLMTRGKRPSDYRELLSYYFDDTMLMPLMVQQNYLNYDPIKRGTTNPSNSSSLKQRQMRMKMIANAADAMSFGDTIHTLNNFSLSPIQGYYSVILPTGLICGSYEKIMPFDNFFPTFPAMLGKLSTARKNFSLLQTMRDEMISSIKDGNYNGNGDLLGIMMEVQDVREYYVPLWRREIMQKLIAGDVGGTINRLDDYHLTKDDLIGLNELATLGDKTLNLYANNVPAKVKNSLTRNYNKKHQMSRFRRGGNNNNNGDGDQDDDGDDILENGLDMNGMSADGAEDDVE